MNKRYLFLDSLRGFALVNMIAFHLLWDLVYMYGLDFPWYFTNGAYIWQQGICWTFILLSGFCFSFSKKQYLRGLMVFGGGIIVSITTLIFMPGAAVRFGILTCIGSCMLITAALKKPFNAINSKLGLGISALFFFVLRNVNDGFLGFESLNLFMLPEFLYKNFLTAFLGFPHSGFSSSDYFSLFPWLFLYLCGYFLYRIIGQKEGFLKLKGKGNVPVLSFLGKNSLWVYLVHQPLIYGICLLIFDILGFSFY